MGVVRGSRAKLEPASPVLRSEPAIVSRSRRPLLAPRSAVDWDALTGDYDHVRELIAHVATALEDEEPARPREKRTRSGSAAVEKPFVRGVQPPRGRPSRSRRRRRWERLCRLGARPPFVHERLRLLAGGRVAYQ